MDGWAGCGWKTIELFHSCAELESISVQHSQVIIAQEPIKLHEVPRFHLPSSIFAIHLSAISIKEVSRR